MEQIPSNSPRSVRPLAPPLLPILQRREEIEAAISGHQVCIICGETGSGKTTQLPQICLGLGRKMIGHTQPRRLAARSVAARIAEEMDVQLGGLVGVKIRFGDTTSRSTRIKLMTDGILLAEMQGDRDLRQYDTIIIDEAHERGLNIDFLLGYLKTLLPRRPDLKVIVTSATINPAQFSEHFGGAVVAPVIEVSGRMYPVSVRYLAGQESSEYGWESGGLTRLIVDAVDELTSPSLPPGDILVFVPGEKDIRDAMTALRRSAGQSGGQSGGQLEILPLFSRLTNAEQDRIFKKSSGQRVIIATNVAETSLTVPGIRYVVDSGLVRESRYDPRTRVQRLPIVNISQASAKQRSGRCGRVSEGVCLRLYGSEEFGEFAAFTRPEILRTNLASVILQMRGLGLGAIEEFPFVERPDAAMIADGYATLHELGALTLPSAEGELTPIGQRLARLPVDPKVGRMVIAAESEGCVPEALVLAAALSIQDPRERPMARQRDADIAHLAFYNETSDFLVLLAIWDQYRYVAQSGGGVYQWCRDRFLNATRMNEWAQTVRQLKMMLSDGKGSSGGEDESDSGEDGNDRGLPEVKSGAGLTKAYSDKVHRALMTGLLSNVCCREDGAASEGRSGTQTWYKGSRGNKISIFPGSVLHKQGPRWLMSAELVQTTRLFARTCARVESEWVEELAAHVMQRTVTDAHFDKDLGRAVAWERVMLAGAVIVPRRKVDLAQSDPVAARDLFLRHGLVRGECKLDVRFMRVNAAEIQAAKDAVAMRRDPGCLLSEDEAVALLSARVPRDVIDSLTFNSYISSQGESAIASALLTRQERIKDAPDGIAYPAELMLDGVRVTLEYALEPGRDRDGLTFTVPLAELSAIARWRYEWLVPGMLGELVAAAIKNLPKAVRSQVLEAGALMLGGNHGNGSSPEGKPEATLEALAEQLAGILTFGALPLSRALSEACAAVLDVAVPIEAWPLGEKSGALPTHLRPRVEVVDQAGKPCGSERNISELVERLAPRVAQARAAAQRDRYRQSNITTWSFGTLEERVVPTQGEPQEEDAFPAVVDRGTSVSLTLMSVQREAVANSWLGVRRLFVLACSEELSARITSLSEFAQLRHHFSSLGEEAELIDSLACIVSERVFMFNQSAVTSKEAFEARRDEQWGRLGQATIEVGGVIARLLDSRFQLAARFGRGTPRLWASSVADMREQSAYLMPKGFLKLVPWENLRQYPRYVEGMRQRLFSLREDGSGVETKALAELAPRWKRFTGAVAGAMSAERAAGQDVPREKADIGKGLKERPALPNARRAAPSINADGGEWAMQPGVVPAPVERYRWSLEEFRLGLFAPATGGVTVTASKIDDLWNAALKDVQGLQSKSHIR
jgi:ATP-dependent helicase HrpA